MLDILSHCLVLIACSLTFFIALDLFKKRHILLFSRQNNGYRFYPIIGNGYHFLGQNMLVCLNKLMEIHKFPCNIWSGHNYLYVTNDPSEIKIILNDESTVEKGCNYHDLKKLFGGNTLLIEPHDEWKTDRKVFSKSFTPKVLSKLVEPSYKKSFWLIEELENNPMTIELFEVFVISIVTDSFSGKEGQFTLKECYNIAHNLQMLDSILGRRLMTYSYYPDILYYRSLDGKEEKKNLNELLIAMDKVIKSKREELRKVKEHSVPVEDLPLIEQLLRNEHNFSEEKISRNVLLFILASIHTTATSMFFALVLLAMNPEVQEKVYQEVLDTVGLTNPITQRDLPNLKYTEMAIYESMRIMTTAPTAGRYVSRDLNLGTKILPAGSNIIISMFHLHRDEKYWKDPFRYDPDRFLPEEVAKRHPYTFIPFSAGPKNCIGMKYAMMVLKITVASVVRYHKFHSNYKSVKDIKLEGSVVTKISGPVDCSVTPRRCS